MTVSWSDKEVIHGEKSIFLAGPTSRTDGKKIESWRDSAVKILEELGFDGVVYVPEGRNKAAPDEEAFQFGWEWEALHDSKVIVFWIPRIFPDFPAMCTNVEFGFYMNSDSAIIYGRPDNADACDYLDRLYAKARGLTPSTTLRDTLKRAVAVYDI